MEKIKLKELKQVIKNNLMDTEVLGKNLILNEPNDSDVEKIYDDIKLKVIKNIIYDTNTNIVYKGKYEEYCIDPQDIENIKFVKDEIMSVLQNEKDALIMAFHCNISENDELLYRHSIHLEDSSSYQIIDECLEDFEFLINRENFFKNNNN